MTGFIGQGLQDLLDFLRGQDDEPVRLLRASRGKLTPTSDYTPYHHSVLPVLIII